ncbi:MAG: ribosome small subunit-dependent GTPase A [Pirellulales bacterium]
MAKRKKIRTEFRKGHQSRQRKTDITREVAMGDGVEDRLLSSERVSGKGELTRHRTIVGDWDEEQSGGMSVLRDVDQREHLRGRVLSVHGLTSRVLSDADGREYQCATRRVLKNLSTDQRHVVAAGDIVYFRPEGDDHGFIERIEPRFSSLCRTSKGRQHVLVANVDQVLIVSSASEPTLKPNLIDRVIVEGERMHIRPIVCINKIDLVDPADLQPLAGVYGQMGYEVLLVSARLGIGVERLRSRVAGKATVVAGQSGVGKSSLLNTIDTGLELRVGAVSTENQKGKHTTTAARLIPLSQGGFVVDTPGIRQFQLWDVIPEEVAGYYRDLRPFINLCKYQDCTHSHEDSCGVKDAVADGKLDARRYESFCHLCEGDEL